MEIIPLAIPDVLLIKPRIFEDARGFFCETYNEKLAEKHGLPTRYVQDNVSLSKKAGTIRGLHFQRPPFAQDKLIRVLKGRTLDVAVDLRKGSPFFGRHVAVELSAGMEQVFIPAGFAHGFCTLEDDTEVFYKVTTPYSPANDGGIIWNDSDLGIEWTTNEIKIIISDKDRLLPRLRDLPEMFTYERTRA